MSPAAITVLSILRTLGRTKAVDLIFCTDLTFEAVYEALVHLESNGLARVEVMYPDRAKPLLIEWVAI